MFIKSHSLHSVFLKTTFRIMESTSLVKALGLLEATASSSAGRSLAELATEVGVPKPTAHRILKTLTSLGFLERGAGGIYRQTAKVQQLVSSDASERLLEIAEPLLRKLHGRTLETVNLGVLRYDRVVYVRVLESPQPLRRVATPDSVDPFHSTALGRAIAAFLPTPQLESLLKQARLQPATHRTLTNLDSLRSLLARVARLGYALEVDETDVGVTCIGAPVLVTSEPRAAISLSLPTARATTEVKPLLIKQVQATARKLGSLLQGMSTGSKHDATPSPKRLSRSKA
jgi:DNA-binding IclR family transcriptional regulator